MEAIVMISSREFAHVFLTRFNLPSGGVEARIRAQEGWLRERTELFERYTVPSLRSQTTRQFTWIVYLDPLSPAWLMDRMSTWSEEGLLTPLYRESVSADELLRDIRETVPSTGWRHLITSNIDNDDALASDFAERVQWAALSASASAAIYLARGLIRDENRLYIRRDRHNAFCSVIDSGDRPTTCWADWHNRLHLSMPVRRVWGAPAWLQVVHGSNVSNRARGRLTSPANHVGRFPEGAFAGIVTPTAMHLVRDGVVDGPVRLLRGQSRAAVRSLGVKVLGKARYDTLKDRLM